MTANETLQNLWHGEQLGMLNLMLYCHHMKYILVVHRHYGAILAMSPQSPLYPPYKIID